MKVLVSTDSSCLINNEMLKKYEINLFPLNVIIDGEEFLDGVTINQEQLCEAMRSGKNIKTSTPAYGTIIEYFDGLFSKGYDHIIHFTISSKLSSMYSLFETISKEEYEGKLTVIDGYSVSLIMLSHVLYAYEEVLKGTPVEEIYNNVQKRKESSAVYFVPENLTALKNGGRISPAIAAIGNTIGIKPLIVLKEGALEKYKMIKNTKHTFTDKFDELIQEFKPVDYDYTLIQFDAKPTTLEYIYNHMAEVLGQDNVVEGIVPINVCAHCGPGTVGILVSPKINTKSIKQFM